RAVNEAVKLNPNFANAYINLGNWYNELGRYEEAIEAFTNVTRIAPKFAYAYFSRSLLNLYLGRGDFAGDDASKLLDLAHKRLNASAWPYPIVAYLRREISKDSLLSLATDNDKMTEARTYMGLALS